MSAPITIADLERTRTVTDEGAALLRAIAIERRSFISYALPRDEGKSTLLGAILGEAPPEIATHGFFGSDLEARVLLQQRVAGYVVVPEIDRVPRPAPGCLWGDQVHSLFEIVEAGFALATTLHADSVEELFAVLCAQNGLSDERAARVEVAVKVRSLGRFHERDARRVVESIHEIEGVENGKPVARLLYSWDAATDQFVSGDRPLFLGRGRAKHALTRTRRPAVPRSDPSR